MSSDLMIDLVDKLAEQLLNYHLTMLLKFPLLPRQFKSTCLLANSTGFPLVVP